MRHAWHSNSLIAASRCKLKSHWAVVYRGVKLDAGYRLDLLIEDAIILELKAVESLLPIHEAQLLSYLKLSGKKLGLLINFNVVHLKVGIRRMVNRL